MRYVPKKRTICGRWRVVDGRRRCCTDPKGHGGDCKPYAAVKAAARRAELSDLFDTHDSDDVDCEACAAARRAIDGGCAAEYGLALRCDWARGILRSLYAAHNAGDLSVPGEVEMAGGAP